MLKETVNIIGAGPAGLTAAIVLAAKGVPVRVFEIQPDVGWGKNGEFQGIENWSTEQEIPRLLHEIGIKLNFLCVPYHSGTVYAPDVPPAAISSARPIFYLVKRGDFADSIDVGLKEQALAQGVEIHFNRRVVSPEGPTIMATGPVRADAVAFGMTFTTGAADRSVVLLDDRFAPKGYGYLLTNGGNGTMAAVLYRDFHKGEGCFANTERFFKEMLGGDISAGKRFCSYGNYFVRKSCREGNRLYVGESAGFQDALWGFGLRYAVVSGYLAAKSILDGVDYDLLWQERLRPTFEISLANRCLFERFGHPGYRYLAGRLRKENVCEFLGRHYNRTYFKRLLVPLAKSSSGRGSSDPLPAERRIEV